MGILLLCIFNTFYQCVNLLLLLFPSACVKDTLINLLHQYFLKTFLAISYIKRQSEDKNKNTTCYWQHYFLYQTRLTKSKTMFALFVTIWLSLMKFWNLIKFFNFESKTGKKKSNIWLAYFYHLAYHIWQNLCNIKVPVLIKLAFLYII